jgi:predicted secreted protein
MKILKAIGVFFFFLAGCTQAGNVSPTTSGTAEKRVPAEYSRRLDTLTPGEVGFLKKLAWQNKSLIWAKQVERLLDKDSSIILSKLIFPANFLADSGYRYFELSGRGLLTHADITYFFDRGQGYTGYGSVIGDDTAHFTHTIRGCGVTACVTEVYNADKNIAEISK